MASGDSGEAHGRDNRKHKWFIKPNCVERKLVKPHKDQVVNCQGAIQQTQSFVITTAIVFLNLGIFARLVEDIGLKVDLLGTFLEQDLNLGFSSDFKTITELIQVPNYDGSNKDNNSVISFHIGSSSSSSSVFFLYRHFFSISSAFGDGVDYRVTSSRGLSTSFMTMPSSVYNNSSGFSLMPSLNFSLDNGLGNNNNNLQETNTTSGRFLFPFVGLKQVSSTSDGGANENVGDQSTNGYWNGMLGGGSW
ncbi:hypothetical protein HAX54_050288 [Datura stramonium]|uniref:Uncharacterized protein n=1 Tax=Datura stramonium TaxID=4076 RepID=A0ABS8SW80_DATST|nr:hypothetical protein [Datura stramonium]